ncbi:thioredoxin family protein [Alicyclobacillus dauci]|uniref:Thioredoxin family protein n=1 Tax=Alicyclobacillus dauci TaxID=1475485 RepID=A0ABY6Z1H5_9BACL|nr:thioredoxin family protein [Alicyclobacillus dauci]WAH36692.1 thioredoxin family protein [Alicyclobacillus dauci]
MIKPIDSLRTDELLTLGSRFAVFFYTPLCGTCKLARRMLEIVDETLPELVIYSVDANFASSVLQQWQVKSVPALAYIVDGELESLQFAFGGVDELYDRLGCFFKH